MRLIGIFIVCTLFYYSALNAQESELPNCVKSFLPNKLCEFPYAQEKVVLGISNPNCNSLTGIRQAWLRAYLVAALQENVKVSVVADFYSSRNESSGAAISKFEEMFSIESQFNNNKTLKLIASYILSTGETIVFAQVAEQEGANKSNPKQKNGLFKIKGSLYHIESILERGQHLYKTNYEIFSQNELAAKQLQEQYEVNSFNNLWYSISGSFNGVATVRTNSKYFYSLEKPSLTNKNDVQNYVGVSTMEGLWPAYISAILWQIAGVTSYGNPSVSVVNDNFRNLNKQLNRTAESNLFNSKLIKLILVSDRLYPILEIEQINSCEK